MGLTPGSAPGPTPDDRGQRRRGGTGPILKVLILFGLLVAGFVGARPVLGFVSLFLWVVPYWAVFALFRPGQRVRRLTPTSVASVAAGRVVLTGNAEPAWSVATSYFGKKKCVWYESGSARQVGRSWVWLFSESNALPFVLNDGTGRILVLGRRGRWDPAASRADRMAGASDALAREEGNSDAGIDRLLEGSFVPAPDPLYASRAKDASDVDIDRGRRERYVAVGERVTVIGLALPYSPAPTDDRDACRDGGESIGLPGRYVLGSDSSTHLDILAGTPADVVKRGRFVMMAGILGTIAEVVCILAALTLGH